jgi:activator of HSP90 ATPase
VGLALGIGAAAAVGVSGRAEAADEIVRDMESVHQEIEFKASPERLYAALTDAKLFHKAVLLSDAVKTGMVKSPQPAVINAVAGGEFAVFGGYISGRQIELVPNVRLVQAWRSAGWAIGTYSIARFALARQGSGALLTFDHTGFPKGEAEHLAQAWKANYWRPLDAVLSP